MPNQIKMSLPTDNASLLASCKQFVSGGMGGICLVLAGHPMDTIKVYMQTMPTPKPGEKPKYTSSFDCARRLVQREGPMGFYKGMLAPLIGATPVNAVIFWGYGLGVTLQTGGSPTDTKNLTNRQITIAGMISGMCASMVNAPVERVKCLLQVQKKNDPNPKYNGFWDCCKKVYREGGIRSSYKGLFPTLVRDIPASGAYFITYEMLKKHTHTYLPFIDSEALVTVFAGGMAGIGFWAIGIPADVVKSRYQTAESDKYGRVSEVVKSLYHNNRGLTGFYRGAFPVFLRAFPANAACFFGYEYTMKFLNNIL